MNEMRRPCETPPLRLDAVDGDGVSLAAIKALSERVKALEARNKSLEDQLAAIHARLPRFLRADENRRPPGAP